MVISRVTTGLRLFLNFRQKRLAWVRVSLLAFWRLQFLEINGPVNICSEPTMTGFVKQKALFS